MTTTLSVRVMVQDAWDEIKLDLPSTTPLTELKQRALALAHVRGDPAWYLVKYRGAPITDESLSLADWGVVPNAALIISPRRRRPVV
jgi:hypothetical protein